MKEIERAEHINTLARDNDTHIVHRFFLLPFMRLYCFELSRLKRKIDVEKKFSSFSYYPFGSATHIQGMNERAYRVKTYTVLSHTHTHTLIQIELVNALIHFHRALLYIYIYILIGCTNFFFLRAVYINAAVAVTNNVKCKAADPKERKRHITNHGM